MASIPSPAATAAGGSSVTVEDESSVSRRCCGCCSDRPESDFSGAQLKKKGKRVCKACVEKREWAEAKEADAAAAAKFTARPFPAAASNRAAAATAAVCVVCGKSGAKLRACGRCRSLYCSAVCLKLHSSGDVSQCTAVRSLPPLSIADEDRITADEIELHWPRLQQRMLALMSDNPLQDDVREHLAELRPDNLTAVAELYPPNPALPWWTHASPMRFCNETTRSTELDGLAHDEFFPPLPPSLDSSRLFHRLLRYLIYYYRHVDPLLIHPRLRSYIDVQSDDEGVLPACVDDEGNTRLVAYCTHVDESGQRTLLPMNVRLVKGKERSVFRGVVYLQQGGPRWALPSARGSDRRS